MSTNNTANSGRQFQYEDHILPDGRVLPIRIRHRPMQPTPAQIPPNADSSAESTGESSKPSAKASDYLVGYRKPPEATKFKAGQSGNSKGRPKGSPNIVTAFVNALKGNIIVMENGRSIKMSRPEALAHKAFAMAIKGNPKFFEMLMKASDHWEQKQEKRQRSAADDKNVDQADQETIDLFLKLMRGKPDENDGGGNDRSVH